MCLESIPRRPIFTKILPIKMEAFELEDIIFESLTGLEAPNLSRASYISSNQTRIIQNTSLCSVQDPFSDEEKLQAGCPNQSCLQMACTPPVNFTKRI